MWPQTTRALRVRAAGSKRWMNGVLGTGLVLVLMWHGPPQALGGPGPDCSGATGSCCEAQATPGCEDSTCCNTVCSVMGLEYCCLTEWDASCAANAFFFCGNKCEVEVCSDATGSCCEAHPTPGCEDPTCCNTVCSVMGLEYCCQTGWTAGCAANAFYFCGNKCEVEVCSDATGSCCEAHPTPGCEDPTCCNSVCSVPGLEYCCQTGWTAGCAANAFYFCGNKCEMEVCSDATGSCCKAHPTPGCEDPTCCNSVCSVPGLENCCQTEWTAACAANAFFICGNKCEMEVCSDATGSCCVAHPTPGCEDPNCCNTVCSVLGLENCCQTGWTTGCAATAESVCGTLCTGACCEPNDCIETTPDECLTAGAFQGLETVCESARVCCFGDGSCADLAPVCCEAQGGTPKGASTSCDSNCCTDADCPPDPSVCFDSICDPADNTCKLVYVPECRVSTSKKGSLLAFSKIELKWNASGALTQDTFVTIVNDYTEDVFVQWYFINGDAPLGAVFNGGLLVERAHRGWNWADCMTELTHNESTYMSMARGTPLGCQPFTILDPGTPPGRPDPEGAPGDRILRGYAIAFAVDQNGEAISWNHLSGSVDIVNYADRSAWEFNGFAAQCVAEPIPGLPCSGLRREQSVAGGPSVGKLRLDGIQYDLAFDLLLLDFYAVDSLAFSPGVILPGGVASVLLDTDLTLYPVDVDLRQDNDGPVTTKAKIDIWNQNEDGFSGSIHCITCWDQTLLSNYAATNNFLIGNIHTDKGKARIDGVASNDCDPVGSCCNLSTDPDCFPSANHPVIDRVCSKPAALLGVSNKLLFFNGPGIQSRQSDAGMNLVGQGIQSATIQWDIITPPQPLTTDEEEQVGPEKVGVETTTTITRTLSSGERPTKSSD